MEKITHEYLISTLSYDKETGLFRWINNSGRYGRIPAGSIAGHKSKINGYIQINASAFKEKAHRLAWFYIFGEWPDGEIDHINQNRTDNRICNLRVVTRAQNLMNKTTYKSNTSGSPGVTWHKRVMKWQSRISKKTIRIHLGYFDSYEDAVECYSKHKKLLHVIE